MDKTSHERDVRTNDCSNTTLTQNTLAHRHHTTMRFEDICWPRCLSETTKTFQKIDFCNNAPKNLWPKSHLHNKTLMRSAIPLGQRECRYRLVCQLRPVYYEATRRRHHVVQTRVLSSTQEITGKQHRFQTCEVVNAVLLDENGHRLPRLWHTCAS